VQVRCGHLLASFTCIVIMLPRPASHRCFSQLRRWSEGEPCHNIQRPALWARSKRSVVVLASKSSCTSLINATCMLRRSAKAAYMRVQRASNRQKPKRQDAALLTKEIEPRSKSKPQQRRRTGVHCVRFPTVRSLGSLWRMLVA